MKRRFLYESIIRVAMHLLPRRRIILRKYIHHSHI